MNFSAHKVCTAIRHRLEADPRSRVLNAARARLAKSQLQARHDHAREVIQKIYTGAIGAALAHAQSEVLRNIHAAPIRNRRRSSAGRANKIRNSAEPVVKLLFNLDAFRRIFNGQMDNAGSAAYELSAQGMQSELGLPSRQTPGEFIQQFLAKRKNVLSDVPEEIYESIKGSLKEGMDAGDTAAELAARVKAKFGDIEDGRAMTIARTETSVAYGDARMKVIKQAGIKFKSWLSADDGNVRASHMRCEEQGAIPIDQAFSNGLMFPGDPSGEAADVCNCRCVLISEEGADEF